MVKSMLSESTITDLKSDSFLGYFVEGFKIEVRKYCVAFVLSIKKPSSI